MLHKQWHKLIFLEAQKVMPYEPFEAKPLVFEIDGVAILCMGGNGIPIGKYT